jgi:hypothetical protein
MFPLLFYSVLALVPIFVVAMGGLTTASLCLFVARARLAQQAYPCLRLLSFFLNCPFENAGRAKKKKKGSATVNVQG